MRTMAEIKKLNRDSDEYQREANRLARLYVTILPCRKCSYPRVEGYCCTTCGTSSPDTTVEQDAEFERKYGK